MTVATLETCATTLLLDAGAWLTEYRLCSVTAIFRSVIFPRCFSFSFSHVCHTATDEKPDSKSPCAPDEWPLPELFTPVQRVFDCLYLMSHCLFDLRYGMRNRIAGLVHASLKCFFGKLFSRLLRSTSQS